MLRMAPGQPAAIRRAANSCEQTNVPFSTMSTTDRHPFGLRSAAATGKLPAALFTRMPTAPNEASTVSNAAVTDSGCRTSIATPAATRPRACHAPRAMPLVAAPDGDRSAQPRELDRHGLAEAGAAAGHQYDLAVERAGRKHRGAKRRRFGKRHGSLVAPPGST